MSSRFLPVSSPELPGFGDDSGSDISFGSGDDIPLENSLVDDSSPLELNVDAREKEVSPPLAVDLQSTASGIEPDRRNSQYDVTEDEFDSEEQLVCEESNSLSLIGTSESATIRRESPILVSFSHESSPSPHSSTEIELIQNEQHSPSLGQSTLSVCEQQDKSVSEQECPVHIVSHEQMEDSDLSIPDPSLSPRESTSTISHVKQSLCAPEDVPSRLTRALPVHIHPPLNIDRSSIHVREVHQIRRNLSTTNSTTSIGTRLDTTLHRAEEALERMRKRNLPNSGSSSPLQRNVIPSSLLRSPFTKGQQESLSVKQDAPEIPEVRSSSRHMRRSPSSSSLSDATVFSTRRSPSPSSRTVQEARDELRRKSSELVFVDSSRPRRLSNSPSASPNNFQSPLCAPKALFTQNSPVNLDEIRNTSASFAKESVLRLEEQASLDIARKSHRRRSHSFESQFLSETMLSVVSPESRTCMYQVPLKETDFVREVRSAGLDQIRRADREVVSSIARLDGSILDSPKKCTTPFSKSHIGRVVADRIKSDREKRSLNDSSLPSSSLNLKKSDHGSRSSSPGALSQHSRSSRASAPSVPSRYLSSPASKGPTRREEIEAERRIREEKMMVTRSTRPPTTPQSRSRHPNRSTLSTGKVSKGSKEASPRPQKSPDIEQSKLAVCASEVSTMSCVPPESPGAAPSSSWDSSRKDSDVENVPILSKKSPSKRSELDVATAVADASVVYPEKEDIPEANFSQLDGQTPVTQVVSRSNLLDAMKAASTGSKTKYSSSLDRIAVHHSAESSSSKALPEADESSQKSRGKKSEKAKELVALLKNRVRPPSSRS